MSYSQLGQDLKVLSFFRNRNNLYFIDIGANDGVNLSNTYLLEKKYNWRGICSEPLPSAFEKLCKCRNVICDDNAIFSKSNLLLRFSESNLYSGITEYIDAYQYIKKCNQIDVKTLKLEDLLKKYNAPNIIHYLSLDTEGSELEILKSVNFKSYKFLYINLEHNYIEPKRSQIKNLLFENEYLYVTENKWDDDYIHLSTIIGTYYYEQNYNKPIIISLIKGNKFKVSSSYWENDEGKFENGLLNWNNLGKGKIYYDHIDYGENNIWYREDFKLSIKYEKFIVLKGLEGFGDRLQCLLQTIEYSLKTNRCLVIDWRDEHWCHDKVTGFEFYFNLLVNSLSFDYFLNNFSKNKYIFPTCWENKLNIIPDEYLRNKEYVWKEQNDYIQEIIDGKKSDLKETIVVYNGTLKRNYIYRNIKYMVPHDYIRQKIRNEMELNNLKSNTYNVLHLRCGCKTWYNGVRESKNEEIKFIKTKYKYFDYLYSNYKNLKDNKNELIIITDSIDIGNEFISKYSCGRLLKNRINIQNGKSGIHKVSSSNLPYCKKKLNEEVLIDFYIMSQALNLICDNDSLLSLMALNCKNYIKWL